MNLLEQFDKTYWFNAHPYRWSREPVQYPRQRDKIYPVNTNEDIERGYRQFHLRADDPRALEGEVFCYPRLVNLRSSHYQPIRCNIERDLNDRHRKNWILLTYPAGTKRHDIIIDIDGHNKNPDKFYQKVRDIENSGLVGWFNKTPGRLIDGVYCFNLNFTISLDKPIILGSQSEKLCHQISDLLKWDWDSDTWGANLIQQKSQCTRNFRFPGQYNMEYCHVDSDNEIIIPVSKNNDFGSFLDHWSKRPIMSLSLLREMVEEPTIKPKEIKPAKPPTRISSIDVNHVDTDLVHEHNTFTAGLKHVARIVRKYRGNRAYRDTILHEAVSTFRLIRPPDSDTAKAPYQFCKNRVDHLLASYISFPGVMNSSGQKETDDLNRFSPYRQYFSRKKKRERFLKQIDLEDRDKVRRMLHLIIKLNGRVYYKLIYGKDGIWNSVRQWNKWRHLFPILQEYRKDAEKWDDEKQMNVSPKGECRQYAVSISGGEMKKKKQCVARQPVSVEPVSYSTMPDYACFESQISQIQQETIVEPLNMLEFRQGA